MKSVLVELKVTDIMLKGEIYLPDDNNKNIFPGLLLCHGVPGGVRPSSNRNQGYRFLAKYFSGAGFATMIFNFRGTGESEGNFNLLEWMGDLEAIINLFADRPEIDPKKLFLMGFSGGAAVSVCVASKDPRIKALVLGACPARFENLFPKEHLSGIIKWARGLGIFRDENYPDNPEQWLRDLHSVRAVDHIHKISPRPLLLLHGDQDKRVHIEHAEELYDRAGEPKEISIIPGAGHQLRTEKRAVKKALVWLQQL